MKNIGLHGNIIYVQSKELYSVKLSHLVHKIDSTKLLKKNKKISKAPSVTTSFGSPIDSSLLTGDIVNPPQRKTWTKPTYPEELRSSGKEGIVKILIGVDEEGKAFYGEILKTTDVKFNTYVLQWAKKLRFQPAQNSKGREISCYITLDVDFSLVQ